MPKVTTPATSNTNQLGRTGAPAPPAATVKATATATANATPASTGGYVRPGAAVPARTGSSEFRQPGVVRPDRNGAVYLKPVDHQKHWFSPEAYTTNAIAMEFRDPSNPANQAPVEGGSGGVITGANGKPIVNGGFGGPILELRVGQRITETIDASTVHEPIVVHKHGTLPMNAEVAGKRDGAAKVEADMNKMMALGPKVGDTEPGVGGTLQQTVSWEVGGRARTRAEHSHTHGFNLSLVADQVRRGLISPMIVRDATSDALEKAGLPHTLGKDDLVMILQDQQQLKSSKQVGNRIKDDTDQDGKLGNQLAVNGEFTPTFDVKTGLMRLRVQNFSTARQTKLAFDNGQDFYVVAGQQGFLTTPRKIDGKAGVLLGPAEGVEIVWQPDPTKAKPDGSVSLISREFTPDNGMFGAQTPHKLEADEEKLDKQGRPIQGTAMNIMKFNVPSTLAPAPKSIESLLGPQGSLTALQTKLAALPSRSIAQLEADIKSGKVGTRSFQLEGAPLSDGAQTVFDTLAAKKTFSKAKDAAANGAEFDELVKKGLLTKTKKPGEFELNASVSVDGRVSPKAKLLFDQYFMRPLTVSEADLAAVTKNSADVAELKKAGNLAAVPGKPGQYEVRDLARTINGKLFDLKQMNGTIVAGSKEVWTLDNPSDMPHPFHIHGREFRIVDIVNADGTVAKTSPLYRSTKPGELGEMADTINLAPGQRARVEVDFSDAWPGEMLMVHCHNLEHEDGVDGHGMMQMFSFVMPNGPDICTTKPAQ